ncbi:MAG: hypothetical protein WCD24_21690 [Serratia inhibens]|uniref:hypothetical protein n=1 Tax=Serratia inhibens TaxID=2338073 RepID=UPI003C7CFFDD
MRKSAKVISAAIILGAAALVYAWPYIQMEFAGSANYTEQDQREYNFYTPEVLRDMPRISKRYDFDFANITGPAKHVNVVKFYGVTEVGEVEKYLISKKYVKQDSCDINATCWTGSDPLETIYVGTLTGENTVIVQVVYNFS